jgi:hypothetical protein
MARAVERGEHVPAIYAFVPGIPESPARYAEVHPDRVKKFPNSVDEIPFTRQIVDKSRKSNKPWRHELQHDAESAFWLLFVLGYGRAA